MSESSNRRASRRSIVGVALLAAASLAIVAVVGRGAARDHGEVEVDPAVLAAANITLLDTREPVPDIKVTDLDGVPRSTAGWPGKVTVVNFWGSWCAPCVRETPDFVALQARYPDHVQFIGLAVNDTEPAVREFAARFGVNYPLALVELDAEEAFGGLIGYPTTFIVDRQGRIVQMHIGLVNPRVYEQEIRVLAGLPPLADPED